MKTAIWRDEGFGRLSVSVQHLYLLLLSQPDVNICGLLALRERYWASLRKETPEATLTVLAELEAAGLVVADLVTQELLIVGWLKHNHGLDNPKVTTAIPRLIETISSPRVRATLLSLIPLSTREKLGLPDSDPSSDRVSDRVSDTLSDRECVFRERTEYRVPLPQTVQSEVKGESRPKASRAVLQVWQEWVDAGDHRGAKLTPARADLIRRRLTTWDESYLMLTVAGIHLDPWNRGENPTGKRYDSLELALRDAEHIERFHDLAVAQAGKSGESRGSYAGYEFAPEQIAEWNRVLDGEIPAPSDDPKYLQAMEVWRQERDGG